MRIFSASIGVKGSDYRVYGEIKWHYFADNADVCTDTGQFTFYDSRAATAHTTNRSEWRLYYYDDFLSVAEPGDALILTRTQDNTYLCLVFQQGSGWLRAASALFGIDANNRSLQSIPEATLDHQTLNFAQLQILEELGVELSAPPAPSDEDIIVARFGSIFPTTSQMSAFAREQMPQDSADPDTALIGWLGREEALFRALEAVQVRQQLDRGFDSVEHFISYSLSIQNRRKSRMGHALQNHLAALFTAHNLRFGPQAFTEGKNKPDFLFPGALEYHDPTFSAARLCMLAAKSSAKDRWRQILTEAARLPEKHLCTLEAGISTDQTTEMATQGVRLVIPAALHITYTPSQQSTLLTLGAFVEYVRSIQT